MANWVYPTAQEITGATKIKDADNKIQAAMNDLVNWANNTGAYSPNLGASFNVTTLNAMTDVLLTSITSGDGLRWNGTDFVNTPIYNRSEQDARYIQLSGNQTITGTKTFSNGIVSTVTGNASTATTLQTARTISLTGDVSGSVSFNGSSDVSITATVADNSHNHNTLTGLTASIAELNYNGGATSNIQSQINGVNSLISSLNSSKANISSPSFTGIPTAPTATLSTDNTQIATTAYANAMAGGTTVPAKSLATNGYVKMANGLIIQWGRDATTGGNVNPTVTFPLAFPNACFRVLISIAGDVGNGYYVDMGVTDSPTATNFVYYRGQDVGTSPMSWLAIGY